jgi:hypothetical protein
MPRRLPPRRPQGAYVLAASLALSSCSLRLQTCTPPEYYWQSHSFLIQRHITYHSLNDLLLSRYHTLTFNLCAPAIMFDWWKRNKPPPSAHDDDIPSPIRKPQHAYRDARMSIPIGEREFYDVIQARKRSSLASSVSNGKWKGKGRLDSGEFLSCVVTSQPVCPAGHDFLCFETKACWLTCDVLKAYRLPLLLRTGLRTTAPPMVLRRA